MSWIIQSVPLATCRDLSPLLIRSQARRWCVGLAVLLVNIFVTTTAPAATLNEYVVPTAASQPFGIAAGPDGALWFTEFSANKVGHITTNGAINEFVVPTANSGPAGIVVGPDNAFWFAENNSNKIGRITIAGIITEHPVPTPNSHPTKITKGPDGALWFTENNGNKIGRITTAGVFVEFPVPTSASGPYGITTGPDGNLWFTESTGNKIGRITPAGVITEFPISTPSSDPAGIASGADHNVWATESAANKILRITLTGTMTEFPVPTTGGSPEGITPGPDGALYVAEESADKIARITTGGAFTEFPVPTPTSGPAWLISGPDRAIWVTEKSGNKIGQLILPRTLRNISMDSFTNVGAQHRTEGESAAFSVGSTVVSAFQAGFFSNVGGSGIGFATSIDGGLTWTNGFLPQLTTANGGTFDRVAFPSVAYDAKHKIWLMTFLGIIDNPSPFSVVSESRSTDGKQWGNLQTIAVSGTGQFFDKPWTVCDDTAASPFYGNCYTEFDDANNGDLVFMSKSTDGGVTFGTPMPTTNHGSGGQPLVQPNGTIIVPLLTTGPEIASFQSVNGGANWSSLVSISSVAHHTVAGSLREAPLPTAEIDGSGRVYVVWSDCRFETGCSANDLILSSSNDGLTWTVPSRIPTEMTGKGIDHFIPSAVVDPATSGTGAHVGVTYYYYPKSACTTSSCKLNVGYIASANAGTTWGPAANLGGPISLSALPTVNLQPTLGDYQGGAFVKGKLFPIFTDGFVRFGTQFNTAAYTLWNPLSPW